MKDYKGPKRIRRCQTGPGWIPSEACLSYSVYMYLPVPFCKLDSFKSYCRHTHFYCSSCCSRFRKVSDIRWDGTKELRCRTCFLQGLGIQNCMPIACCHFSNFQHTILEAPTLLELMKSMQTLHSEALLSTICKSIQRRPWIRTVSRKTHGQFLPGAIRRREWQRPPHPCADWHSQNKPVAWTQWRPSKTTWRSTTKSDWIHFNSHLCRGPPALRRAYTFHNYGLLFLPMATTRVSAVGRSLACDCNQPSKMSRLKLATNILTLIPAMFRFPFIRHCPVRSLGKLQCSLSSSK